MSDLIPSKRFSLAHLILVCFINVSLGGGLEKGFASLQNKDYYGAKQQFEKVLFKEPAGAYYGLSLVHFERKNPFYDINQSLRYINSADSAFQFANGRDQEILSVLGVNRKSMEKLRQGIGQKAYEDAMMAPTDSAFTRFLKDYKFSDKYASVIVYRDSLAFLDAKQSDSVKSYRDFIISYPGARERGEADSLYALRFFQERTAQGDIEGYGLFVREFPANPYAIQAFDSLYYHALSQATEEAYLDFLIGYPANHRTAEIWERLASSVLVDYSEGSFIHLLSTYSQSPLNSEWEEEMGLQIKGVYPIQVNGKTRLFSSEGTLYEGEFSSVGELSEGLFSFSDGEKFGFLQKDGRVRVEAQYDEVFPFHQGASIVEKNGKYGAIDRYGNVILDSQYDELGNLSEGVFAFTLDGNSGYVKVNGDVLIDGFAMTSDFEGDYAVVGTDNGLGLVDWQGKIVEEPRFEWIEPPKNGLSRIKKDGKTGVLVVGVKERIPPLYDYLGQEYQGLRAAVSQGALGYLGQAGDTIIPFVYELSLSGITKHSLHEQRAIVKKNGLYGLIDRGGEELLEFKYEDLKDVQGSWIPFKSRGKWGFIRSGGGLIKAAYDGVNGFYQSHAVVHLGGHYGLLDMSGKLVLDLGYNSIEQLEDTEVMIVETDEGFGLKRTDGYELLPAQYDTIEQLNLRLVKLEKDGNEEVFDIDAETYLYRAE